MEQLNNNVSMIAKFSPSYPRKSSLLQMNNLHNVFAELNVPK